MKAKRKRQPTANDNGVEKISLRDRQALLLANDRMNVDYNNEYVAYLDQRRGMTVMRRIVAHDKSMKRVSDAIDKLPLRERDSVIVHYAHNGAEDVVELDSL
jgi:hypothetical protein